MCRSSTLAEEKRWELLRDDRSESSLRDDRTAHRLCQAMQGPFELVCTRGNVVWKVCATSVTMYIVDIVALFCTKAVKSGSSLRRPNHLRTFTLSTIIVFSSKKGLAEIYTMHSFAPLSNLIFFFKIAEFFADFFTKNLQIIFQNIADFLLNFDHFFRDFPKMIPPVTLICDPPCR